MYAFPNATVLCGGSVPGGQPCDRCPDDMPPAFVLGGVFVNDGCEDCEDFDGIRGPQSDFSDCYYEDVINAVCSEPTDFQLEFHPTYIEVYLATTHPENTSVAYRKTRSSADTCNQTHELSKYHEDSEGACLWPPTITITPST